MKSRPAGPIAWLLLAPLLAWMVAFVAAPTAAMIAVSFCERDEFGRPRASATLANYRRLLDRGADGRRVYLQIAARSVAYAGAVTLACVAAGYPVAWFIARRTPAWRHRLLLAVMIPFWTSFLIRAYAWITLLKSEGSLNALLQWVGVIARPLELLYTPGAVVVGLVHAYLPFMVLPIYASVEKLDATLLEAAADLGARPWGAWAKVGLPLTLPGVFAGVLLVFVPSIAMFAVTDLLGGARTLLLGNVIQNQFLAARDWPFGAALGAMLLAMFAAVLAGVRLVRRRDAGAPA